MRLIRRFREPRMEDASPLGRRTTLFRTMTTPFIEMVIVPIAIACSACNGLFAGTRYDTLPIGRAVACRATDGFATDLRSYVIDITTGADSLSEAHRTAFNLPAIKETTQVFFVTDLGGCTKAAKAHAMAERQDTLYPPPVYLLAVGPTRFVAYNGARAGEFLVHYVLDAKFNVLGSF